MSDKFGPYINRLMTTILDKEQDEFVKDLAQCELNRLNVNIEEFLRKHMENSVSKERKQTEKTLLQEEKKNGK